MTRDDVPLVVDMDGTFFTTDSTVHMMARLRRRPWRAMRASRLLSSGRKDAFKLYLLKHAGADVDAFRPYEPVRRWLEGERALRATVVLATGAPQELAELVAERYPYFDRVVGTVDGYNNTAERKAARLVESYGAGGFDYAGNSSADVEVWRVARLAYVCNASASVLRSAREVSEVAEVL